MKALLTGGGGFIGAHTVVHLLENTDWEIVVLDSLNYAGDVSRLEEFGGLDPRVAIFWHDLRAPIGDILKEKIGKVDYIINMASESHVDRSIADPVPFVHNNVMLALNMLEYAREVRPKKFIQVSTDEVYGPAPEDYSHKEWEVSIPSNPYSASKASQESLAIAWFRTYGLPVAITRTMNNFGERQHPEKFIPVAIDHLLRGDPVPVHAKRVDEDTWQAGSRVWLHARNHADALLWLLEREEFAVYPQDSRPTMFNVAGDRDLPNDAMVRLIAEMLGVEPLIEYVDEHSQRPGHDLRYSLSGDKLRATGWNPPVDFEESLKRTVSWYAERVNHYALAS